MAAALLLVVLFIIWVCVIFQIVTLFAPMLPTFGHLHWSLAVGATFLGLLIGWIVGETFARSERLDAKAVVSLISVMVGGAVIGLFQLLLNATNGTPTDISPEVCFYPVALFVAFAVTNTLIRVSTARKDFVQWNGRGHWT